MKLDQLSAIPELLIHWSIALFLGRFHVEQPPYATKSIESIDDQLSCVRVVVVCKCKKEDQQQHFIHRLRKTLALCVINVSKRLITTWITIVSSEFLNRCLIVPSILRSKRRCKNEQKNYYPRSHSMLRLNGSYLWLLTAFFLPLWMG